MKLLIIYYSMYGNTFKLAQAIREGAAKVKGVAAEMKKVPELMPDKVIAGIPQAKAAREAQKDVPLVDKKDLIEADAIIFGSPTRFGNMSSQLKQFIDQTSDIWMKGQLAGKPGGVFCSTSSMHGGQETTLISMMFPMFHHGMILVGLPYTEEKLATTERGGTPYGPTSVSGIKADQPPTEDDLELARAYGRRVAEVMLKLRS